MDWGEWDRDAEGALLLKLVLLQKELRETLTLES